MQLLYKLNKNGPMLVAMCFAAISFPLLGESGMPDAIRGSPSNDNASGVASVSSKQSKADEQQPPHTPYESFVCDLANSMTPPAILLLTRLSLLGNGREAWETFPSVVDAIGESWHLTNILVTAAGLDVFEEYHKKLELILWLTRSLIYQRPKHIPVNNDTETDLKDMATGWQKLTELLRVDSFHKLLIKHKDALLDKLSNENPLVSRTDFVLSKVMEKILGEPKDFEPLLERIQKQIPLLHQRLQLTAADGPVQISDRKIYQLSETLSLFISVSSYRLNDPGEAFMFWRILQFFDEFLLGYPSRMVPSRLVPVTEYYYIFDHSGARVQLTMSFADCLVDDVLGARVRGESLVGTLRGAHFQIVYYVLVQMAAEQVTHFKKTLGSSEVEKSAIPNKLQHIGAPTSDVIEWVLTRGGLSAPAAATKQEQQAALLEGIREWFRKLGRFSVLYRAMVDRVDLVLTAAHPEGCNNNYDTVKFLRVRLD